MITSFRSLLDENFSYGYDSGFYNLRKDRNSKFQCYYKKARYLPISFRQECVKVALKISDFARNQNKEPVILFSGGLDSEVVIRSFIESNREFSVITNRFSSDLNSHEIEYVENFCSKFNLKTKYIDIDVKDWLISNHAMTLANDSQCSRAEMLPTLKLIHEVYFEMNGVPVLGNGDFYLSKDVNPLWKMEKIGEKYVWNYVEFEYILAWLRYSVKKNIQGSINFFQQTPEIVLAIALDQEIQELIEKNPLGRHTSRSRKYKIYAKYWTDIQIRSKYHGCEKISNLCDKIQKVYLNRNYRDYSSKFKVPVDIFIKNLMPSYAA